MSIGCTRIVITTINVIKGSFGWPRGTLVPLYPSLAVGTYLWLAANIVASDIAPGNRHSPAAHSPRRNRFEILTCRASQLACTLRPASSHVPKALRNHVHIWSWAVSLERHNRQTDCRVSRSQHYCQAGKLVDGEKKSRQQSVSMAVVVQESIRQEVRQSNTNWLMINHDQRRMESPKFTSNASGQIGS